MKDIKKRIIALAAVSCVAVTSAVSCSGKDDSSSASSSESTASSAEGNESSEAATGSEGGVSGFESLGIEVITNEAGNMVKVPLQPIEPNANGEISMAPGMDIEAPDVVKNPSAEPATAYVAVVDDNGQPVTEIVEVTEAGGEKVTESGGQPVTTAIPVTTAVAETTVDDDYVGNTKTMYTLWMDISEDKDYFFEGDFIKLTFKVKDTAPERDYTIAISPDLSNKKGQSMHYDATVLNGTIRVGGDPIQQHDVSANTNVTMYADNVNAKPGDTIDYYINIKNNPGLAAVMMWFSYDSNAFELTSCKPSGEFAEIASKTQVGTIANANAE